MKKVLALIAHDSKKDDMIQLVKAHQEEPAAQYLEEMAARHE